MTPILLRNFLARLFNFLLSLQNSVIEAKREIQQRFQTQAQKQIQIPKEHHRFILGPKGEKLNKLEKVRDSLSLDNI